MIQENIPLYQNEEIIPIQGYEGLYSITSHGRVWSHKRFRHTRWCGNCFLKFRLDKDGYFRTNLYKEDNRVKTFNIHILVAQALIENPNNLPEVNHKDGNKLNNFVGIAANNYEDGNLEWCDYAHNLKHAMGNKLLKYKRSSKYHGVYYLKHERYRNKPWRAQTTNNKRIHIGRFKTEIEAAQAYNNYVIKCNLNRPLNEGV